MPAEFQTYATVCNMHWWYVYFVQVAGVFLGILNRFTAFTFPAVHKQVGSVQDHISSNRPHNT